MAGPLGPNCQGLNPNICPLLAGDSKQVAYCLYGLVSLSVKCEE